MLKLIRNPLEDPSILWRVAIIRLSGGILTSTLSEPYGKYTAAAPADF